MNMFFGASYHGYTNLFFYQKSSDLVLPGPAQTWLMIDEHEDSIGGGWFELFARPPYSGWGDIPGSRHNRSGVLSFADGHVEFRRWLDPQTLVPVLRRYNYGIRVPNGRDVPWLMERSTAPKR